MEAIRDTAHQIQRLRSHVSVVNPSEVVNLNARKFHVSPDPVIARVSPPAFSLSTLFVSQRLL